MYIVARVLLVPENHVRWRKPYYPVVPQRSGINSNLAHFREEFGVGEKCDVSVPSDPIALAFILLYTF